jgi:hypothetical protein
MFRGKRYGAKGIERVSLIIRYRTAQPGVAGIKIVPDPSQSAAEKKLLEGLGFTVIEIAPAPFARAANQHLVSDEEK